MKINGTENNHFILKELGRRIQDMRIASEVTQRKLAELAGVSYSTMQRIENGENIKIENILNVMRALSLLENLEILIPEQEILPTSIVDKAKRKQRVGRNGDTGIEKRDWKWGDEQ